MPKPMQDPLKELLQEEERLPLNASNDDGSEEVAPLTLKELFVEKKLQFDLGDGKMIFFKDPNSISTQDSARMMKLQKMTDGALKVIERNPEDQDGIRRFDRLVGSFIQFILPDLPEEVLTSLDYMKKSRILQYWMDHSGFNQKKAGGASSSPG